MFLIQIVFLMVQQVNVLTGRVGEVLTLFVKMTISTQIIIIIILRMREIWRVKKKLKWSENL